MTPYKISVLWIAECIPEGLLQSLVISLPDPAIVEVEFARQWMEIVQIKPEWTNFGSGPVNPSNQTAIRVVNQDVADTKFLVDEDHRERRIGWHRVKGLGLSVRTALAGRQTTAFIPLSYLWRRQSRWA